MNTMMLWNRGNQSTSGTTTFKATALIRLSLAVFPSFTGEIQEQESYKTKAEAQFEQAVFKFLLIQD
eukprot:2639172-Ditylum_brightwellii.AAC.1